MLFQYIFITCYAVMGGVVFVNIIYSKADGGFWRVCEWFKNTKNCFFITLFTFSYCLSLQYILE